MDWRVCNRQGCGIIKCSHYSNNHGYLCDGCLTDLKLLNGSMTIQQFMNSPASRSYEWENYVESEFKLQY